MTTTADAPQRTSLVTPTRVVTALALGAALLAAAVFFAWSSGPRTITLDVTQPAGQTVVCHFVVDGKPESHEDTAPVTYHFEAHQLRYAIIARDSSPPADVTVTIHDRSGTGGVSTAPGVTGAFTANWWGTVSHIGSMTPTHVATMRKSVIAQRVTGGNEGNEAKPNQSSER